MNHRQRALAAMKCRSTDYPAVQFYYTDVGVAEHGEKLNELFLQYPGDFLPVKLLPPQHPPSNAVDAEGNYYEKKTDKWGTEWEYRIYGRMGHAIDFPIKDMSYYSNYKFPPLPAYVSNADAFEIERSRVRKEKLNYISMRGEDYSFLERLIALRGFEDAMCDLQDNGPLINSFLDRLTEYYMQSIEKLIEMKVDAICFGDDYGTQNSMLLSPQLFREILFPRWKRLFDPVQQAGIHIHFHSCGKINKLFPLFEELGVNSIWPQLPVYDMEELARECNKHRFALAIHTDRAQAMTRGTPDEVRALVRKENKVFQPAQRGGWFYVEVDHGFPFENIVALIDEIYLLRQ